MQEIPDKIEAASSREGRPVSLKLILIGVLALVLAILIATQVIGVLYAIIFPPPPPVPADSTLTSHASSDYGVDEWLYTSKQDSCIVLDYYIAQGGVCRRSPGVCGQSTETETGGSGSNQHIARCVGITDFSIFALRWQAVIASTTRADAPTEFRLEREIFWSGGVPPLLEP